ncbi:MAG: sel1 repeat family protein [Verrucomicrobia bacterium]|nr:sel1 repeat family protein [Verrucomicrobiota bacterium]
MNTSPLPIAISAAPRGVRGRLLAAIFCLGLAGCVSAPPASLRPAVPLVAKPDFNGTFAWVNWKTNLRSHAPGEIGGGNHRPLLPWHRLADSSTVLVTHRPDLLALTYRTKSGRLETRFFDPAAPPAAWRDGELRYDWGTVASGLGLARSSNAVAQLQDGRIVFSSTATDAGMWLVPVYARGEDVITLERAANPADAAELRAEFAAALTRRAAALDGDPAAALALSSAFSSPVAPGIGWERYFAIELLRPAARAGAVDLQLRLAEFLSPTAEGFAIYRRAAATGNLAAQYHVAGAYQHGQGVAKNPPEAVRWYRMAAEAGHPMSQHLLAGALEKGEGLPPNLVEAYLWQRRWAEHAFANPNATIAKEVARTAVDRLGAKLTPAQRAEAEARALDWKPSPPRHPPVD